MPRVDEKDLNLYRTWKNMLEEALSERTGYSWVKVFHVKQGIANHFFQKGAYEGWWPATVNKLDWALENTGHSDYSWIYVQEALDHVSYEIARAEHNNMGKEGSQNGKELHTRFKGLVWACP